MTTQELEKKVDALTNQERKELREDMKTQGDKRYLLRSLWYNYATQEWIE